MTIQASNQTTKYWHYHHEHGHDTKECYDLKQQIEIPVGQGKLQQIGETQQDGRPILHKKGAFWTTTTLQERLDGQQLY